MEKKIVRIETGFHAADLDPMGQIDEAESAEKYSAALKAALEAAFPDAEVIVSYDLNTSGVLPYDLQTRVWNEDGDFEASDASGVDAVCSAVYDAAEWAVYS